MLESSMSKFIILGIAFVAFCTAGVDAAATHISLMLFILMCLLVTLADNIKK